MIAYFLLKILLYRKIILKSGSRAHTNQAEATQTLNTAWLDQNIYCLLGWQYHCHLWLLLSINTKRRSFLWQLIMMFLFLLFPLFNRLFCLRYCSFLQEMPYQKAFLLLTWFFILDDGSRDSRHVTVFPSFFTNARSQSSLSSVCHTLSYYLSHHSDNGVWIGWENARGDGTEDPKFSIKLWLKKISKSLSFRIRNCTLSLLNCNPKSTTIGQEKGHKQKRFTNIRAKNGWLKRDVYWKSDVIEHVEILQLQNEQVRMLGKVLLGISLHICKNARTLL